MATPPFNPFNLFKGNPRVLELLADPTTPLPLLLEEDQFLPQFKKSNNEQLEGYMTYHRYRQLLDYVTQMPQDKASPNAIYKYPFTAAEILAVSNELTFKFFLESNLKIKETKTVEVEAELDSSIASSTHSVGEENKENLDDKKDTNAKPEQRETTEDDFPDVKLPKKQYRSEKVITHVQPLINVLLGYFENPLVHILDGYVCKVLESISCNKFEAFMKHFKVQNIPQILKHIESQSVQGFLTLLINKCLENMLTNQDCLPIVQSIYLSCLVQIDRFNESSSQEEALNDYYLVQFYQSHLSKLILHLQHKVNCLSNYLNEQVVHVPSGPKTPPIPDHLSLYPELILLNMIYSPSSISSLIQALELLIKYGTADHQKQKTHLLSQILKQLIEIYCILKDLVLNNRPVMLKKAEGIKLEQNEESVFKMAQQIVVSCEESFDRFITTALKFVFEEEVGIRNKLSTKITILEILRLLVKHNVYFSRKTLSNGSQFIGFQMLYLWYPHSNMLHNVLTDILMLVLSDPESPLFQKLLQEGSLLKFLYATCKEDAEDRERTRKNTGRACYISHVVKICQKIQSANSQDFELLAQTKETLEWQFIQEDLLLYEKHLELRSLAGLSKMKPKPSVILFSKEQVLTHFKDFLSGLTFAELGEFDDFEPSLSEASSSEEKEYIDSTQDGPGKSILTSLQDDQKYFEEGEI